MGAVRAAAGPSGRVVRGRGGLWLLVGGCTVAFAGIFLIMVPLRIGVWPKSEPLIIALHFGAAVTSLGLAHLLWARPGLVLPVLRHPLVLLPAAVGVWSLLVAPFAPFPLLSLLGAPQLGQGALELFDVAVFVAAGMALRRVRPFGRLLAALVVGVALALPLLMALGPARIFNFADFLAYYGLAAAVAVLAFWSIADRQAAFAVAVGAGLPALVASTNLAAGVALLLVAVPLLIVVHWLQARREIKLRLPLCLLVPAVLVAGLMAAYFIGSEGWVASLTNRYLAQRFLLDALAADPLALITGLGWGHFNELQAVHLNASGAILWDGAWDIFWRDYAHSHNFLLEAVTGAGLFALVGGVAFVAAWPFYARRRLLGVAAAFAVAFSLVSTVWFQVPSSVPLVAVAVGGLSRLPRRRRHLIRWPRQAALAAVLLLALGQAAAAAWLADDALVMRRVIDAYLAPAGRGLADADGCARVPADRARAGNDLLQTFSRLYTSVLNRERSGGAVPARRYDRLAELLCRIEREAVASPAAEQRAVVLLFRARIALDPGLGESRSRFGYVLADWRQAIMRLLAVAPRRTDLAVPYLNWQYGRGRFDEVLSLARAVLALDPADPAGLWFSGSVLIRDPVPERRKEGFQQLSRALAAGIDRWMPVPEEARAVIRREAGPGGGGN